MKYAKIAGSGFYVPDKVVTNDDLSLIVDTNNEWIVERTGIRERHIVTKESTVYMAKMAAFDAMSAAGFSNAVANPAGISADETGPADLDLIIVSTSTPDYTIPSVACMLQAELGAENAMCFDISAACTGYIYGLNIAEQFIKTGKSKCALVVGAESLSKITNWKDRSTCVLFGDGAGASILKADDTGGIIASYIKADGTKGDVLYCENPNHLNPFLGEEKTETDGNLAFDSGKVNMEGNFFSNVYKVTMEGNSFSSLYKVTMEGNSFSSLYKVTREGREVFKFAVSVMQESINHLLDESGYTMGDIACIISHQANIRIIEHCSKKLKVNAEKFYVNLDKYGNTSSASIPIALTECIRNKKVKPGDLVILVGFGGGLTYGGVLVKI